jgi:LuxR family maltose regulon positive regulatory protein
VSDSDGIFSLSLEEIHSLMMSLTAREFDVVTVLAQGGDRKDIAAALCMSENTAKYHLKNVYRKLNFNRAQVIGIFSIWKFSNYNPDQRR